MRNAFPLTGYPEAGKGHVRERLPSENQPPQREQSGSAEDAEQGKHGLFLFCFSWLFFAFFSGKSGAAMVCFCETIAVLLLFAAAGTYNMCVCR